MTENLLAEGKPLVRHLNNEVDSQLKHRLECFRQHAENEVAIYRDALEKNEVQLAELRHSIKRVEEHVSPSVGQVEDWLPICEVVYAKGRFENSDKFLINIGGDYFVQQTAKQTFEFLQRKINAAEGAKTEISKRLEEAERRVEFASSLFSEDFVDIQEPYDEERAKLKSEPREVTTDEDFSMVMSRLEELEALEEKNGELRIGGVTTGGGLGGGKMNATVRPTSSSTTTEEVKTVDSDAEKPKPPRGVSAADYEAFLNKVDSFLEDSSAEEEDEDDDGEEGEAEGAMAQRSSSVESDKSAEEGQSSKKSSSFSPPPARKTSSVRFAEVLEAGPSARDENKPRKKLSILKNKDEKPFVDQAALAAMIKQEEGQTSGFEERNILPATDAFKGVFIERNPIHRVSIVDNAATTHKIVLLASSSSDHTASGSGDAPVPSTSSSSTTTIVDQPQQQQQQPPKRVSKFRAQRKHEFN